MTQECLKARAFNNYTDGNWSPATGGSAREPRPSGCFGVSVAAYPYFIEAVNRQAIRIADAETAMAPRLVL